MNLIQLAERGFVPDRVIRMGIRRLLSRRLRQQRVVTDKDQRQGAAGFVRQLRLSPLAVHCDSANEQHYEVPADFFRLVLGPHLKYSCCQWSDTTDDLAAAEAQMLELTCRRAEVQDGMQLLDLGCGWGSLTLWMAEHYPAAEVTAVSNSHGQRQYIESCCRRRGLDNVKVITTDIRDFEPAGQFDRIVSLEMFEHLRNYELLFARVSRWLQDDGKLFVHVFCHRDTPYLFETEGAANWMGRHFFTGGMMPSADLMLYFQNQLAIQDHWHVSGTHYARTCEAWLANLDTRHDQVLAVFRTLVGQREARVAVQRWRMFFMACGELFRYGQGVEWFVSHYLFQNRRKSAAGRESIVDREAAGLGSRG